MSAILIGAVIDSPFSILHDKLRSNTVQYARRKFGRLIPDYSPWLCFAPLVQELDSRLIYHQVSPRGAIVADLDILDCAAKFLAGAGRPAIDDLPGDPKSWLPSSHAMATTFDDSLRIIDSSGGVVGTLYKQIVDFIVPLGGGRNRGYSTHLARGAIFRSLPKENNAYDVAIDMIHEVGHQVLMVWQSIDPILSSQLDAPVYSQIRKTERPAIQSFHATVALAYMRYLELALPDDPEMQAAAARRGASYRISLSHSLELALHSIRKDCTLTELGEKMFGEMAGLVGTTQSP